MWFEIRTSLQVSNPPLAVEKLDCRFAIQIFGSSEFEHSVFTEHCSANSASGSSWAALMWNAEKKFTKNSLKTLQ